MAQLDRAKEEIGYAKLWLGVAVVTDISLAGWLASASDAAQGTTVLLALSGVTFLGFGIVILNRRIERGIDRIGRL